MITIEDYLNEVSKEVNYDSFAQMISLRTQYGSIDTTVKLISESVKEAMIRHAKQLCDEHEAKINDLTIVIKDTIALCDMREFPNEKQLIALSDKCKQVLNTPNVVTTK